MAKSKGSNNDGNQRRRRDSTDVADWASIEPELLQTLVATVTAGNGAIRFGYSRDGGAYAVGIYGDGKPFTEFRPAGDGVSDWLEGFIIDYE